MAGDAINLLAGIDALGLQTSEINAVRQAHAERVAAVRQRLLRDDAEGRYAPAGLIAELEGRAAFDSRYAFLHRLARSAHFGELLASEYERVRFGHCSEETQECGRLMNLFVTVFDGVCDDASEMLPDTLSALAPILGVFPDPLPAVPPLRRDLCGLATGLGSALAIRLGDAIRAVPADFQIPLSETVRFAYIAQLNELSVALQPITAATERIAAKSIGPFGVALMIPHALHADRNGFEAVAPVAKALGCLFGWVDDLADWREDTASGRVTALSLFLGTPAITVAILQDAKIALNTETNRRITMLSDTLSMYKLDSLALPLTGVVADWLNVA